MIVKRISLFISIMLLAIIALCSVACVESDTQPFGTFEFYDNAGEWINEDFKSENLLRGTENELPQNRTFVVCDREMFEGIFVDDIEELNIDFANEMIIVYTFISTYIAPANIADIAMSESITFSYRYQLKEGTGSATSPFQRWFVVVIDKADYSSVGFYDIEMEITKIETSWQEGVAPFDGYYLRTFDFKEGRVYDTIVTEQDIAEILGTTTGYEADDFNNPKQVTTFTQEQKIALYEDIKTLGFLDWEDRYITDEIIMDGGSSCVSVYFADGTVKSTRIYFKYPPNYQEICQEFEEHFGVNFYYGR